MLLATRCLRLRHAAPTRSLIKLSSPRTIEAISRGGHTAMVRENSIYDIKKMFADRCFAIFDVDGNGGTCNRCVSLPCSSPLRRP